MLAGTLLAHYLMKSGFGNNRALTIIGYSLGSVVTFNCLKHMQKVSEIDVRASRMINDVQFWAGAYMVDHSKTYEEIKEKSEWCTVVNGNLFHLWSKKDPAMPLMSRGVGYPTEAIGAKPIFTEITEEDKPFCKWTLNHQT